MPVPTRIFLIGYRGSGKTTVARLLAPQLQFDWVDSDREIELRAGASITAIFAEQGEAAFRELETEVLVELCQRERTVVALGGGCIVRAQNRDLIAAAGPAVWLTAPVHVLGDRLREDPLTASIRPDLTPTGGPGEIEAVLKDRIGLYRQSATWEVDTQDKSPAEVVAAIRLQLDSER
jgi:shikimate kinase